MGNILITDPLGTNIILNPDEASVEEYAEVIGNIWPQDKDRPIWLLWIHVLAHATVVCEEVRKNRWHKVAKELAEVVAWWLSFSRRVTEPPPPKVGDAVRIVPYIGSSPSDLIWYKYPRVCPVCFGRWLYANCKPTEEVSRLVSDNLRDINAFFKGNPHCNCLSAKKDVEDRSEDFKRFTQKCLREYARRMRAKRKPQSLRETAEMLNLIFANNIEVLSVEEIAFHLLEEVGEVSRSLANLFMQDIQDIEPGEFLRERQDKVVDFAEEIADVFSWSVSLLAKIHRFLECAAQFAEEFKTVEGMPELVRGNLNRTQNVVDLIWTIYGKGSMLVCEHCREFPCNPEHSAHVGKRGQLAGKRLPGAVCNLIRRASEI
jgi:NTP pyrophosphatase (non-canonical NTP hydrolase)